MKVTSAVLFSAGKIDYKEGAAVIDLQQGASFSITKIGTGAVTITFDVDAPNDISIQVTPTLSGPALTPNGPVLANIDVSGKAGAKEFTVVTRQFNGTRFISIDNSFHFACFTGWSAAAPIGQKKKKKG